MRKRDREQWLKLVGNTSAVYPNPKVTVIPTAYIAHDEDSLVITFKLRNLPDISAQLGTTYREFEHTCKVGYWPGLDRARQYLAAVWSWFLFHEGLEGLQYKTGKLAGKPLADPHGWNSPRLHLKGECNMNSIDGMIDWLEGNL